MNRTKSALSTKTLVYYLGSKQRMADYLAKVIGEVACGSQPVLDLFCGMGSASLALARVRSVTSVDVQEYARIVCSALLKNVRMSFDDAKLFKESFDNGVRELETIYAPLLEAERVAERAFLQGDPQPFSDIIEHGCLLEAYRSERPDFLVRAVEACEDKRAKLRDIPYDVVVRYFGGTYFSYAQAVRLSAARNAARDLPPKSRDIVIAAVLSAASHCASTVGGQFAQPLKTVDSSGGVKRGMLEKALRLRGTDVWESIQEALAVVEETAVRSSLNQVVKAECIEYLGTQTQDAFSAIYADPPYSRYHYSRYYHVLETIALGDEPTITVNPATKRPSRGIYRSGRYQSPYSTRRGAREGFERLFRAAASKSPVLVLSYSPYPESKRSTPRMITIAQLEEMAKEHYGSVELRVVDWVNHSKLNAAKLELAASEESEVLLICKR